MHPVRPNKTKRHAVNRSVRSNGVQGRIDLHLHTKFSDGTLSPEEVIIEAQRKGFTIVSICDHDCTDGVEPAVQAGLKYGVRVIPGVEITAEQENLEIHILGYFMDCKDEKFKEKLAEIRKSRIKRIYDMIEKLKEFDINVSAEDVFMLSKDGSVGRPHLARILLNEGFVNSEEEAFRKYLGDKAPCYVRRFNVVPEEAINSIVEAKGIPVYAHPKVTGRDDFIPGFVKAGLRGIEAYHSDHALSDSKHYEELAARYNLLVTGGSDFHGDVKKNVFIGKVDIPYRLVEELEKEARKIQST